MTMNSFSLIVIASLWVSFECVTSHCNSSTAYVEIVTPKSLEGTLLSASASFGPNSYSLEATEVVLLNSQDNDACVSNSKDITTSVDNKIVLIWRGTTNCTELSKVLTLEDNGAVAVLLAMDEGEDIVETIGSDTNDNQNRRRGRLILSEQVEPTIPSRMISEEDGWIITNYIESLTDVTNVNDNNTLTIEISCFDDGYTSSICVMDGTGSFWYIDGEFEQQANDIESNSFYNLPIFKKEGYFGMTDDLYLFASNSSKIGTTSDSNSNNNNTFMFRWVISWEVSDDTSEMVAFCEQLTQDPGNCQSWQTSNTSSKTNFTTNNKFWVNDTLCKIEESYVCLESEDYQIAGLRGTYQLVTDAIGLWIREPMETDMTPGYMVYGYYTSRSAHKIKHNYGFFVVDTVDQKYPAYCIIGDSYNVTEEFRPWLCETWNVVPDNTVNDYNNYDKTDSLASDGVCSDYNTKDATMTIDSDAGKNHEFVCIGNHTLRHTFLEGEYELIANTTTSSGRSVWHFVEGSSSSVYDAYIFYYGDIDDDILWWVISLDPPSVTQPRVYAYCPAMVEHPSDCAACWFFYYDHDWDPDCEVFVKRGVCDGTTTMAPDWSTTTEVPETPATTIESITTTMSSVRTTSGSGFTTTLRPELIPSVDRGTSTSTSTSSDSGGGSGTSAPLGSGHGKNNGTLMGISNLDMLLILVGVIILLSALLTCFCCYMKRRKAIEAGFYSQNGVANDDIELQDTQMENQIYCEDSDNEDRIINGTAGAGGDASNNDIAMPMDNATKDGMNGKQSSHSTKKLPGGESSASYEQLR